MVHSSFFAASFASYEEENFVLTYLFFSSLSFPPWQFCRRDDAFALQLDGPRKSTIGVLLKDMM